MSKAIMIQGAGSNVGKSLIVAGLARHFARKGLKVAPFKPQNMSNNAAVTEDGGEIGRAQALQARAAKIPPHTDMNPVLLKPETDTGAQVVLRGQRVAQVRARDYGAFKPKLLPAVLESFQRLGQKADLIIVEGAGSPAEINLRAGDIANMGFAEAANIPVVLTGDIDRGGVIAQMVGTHAVLPPEDQARIKGFIINKFRGDPTLFAEGASHIAAATGWQDLGICPFFDAAWRLPAEDIMDLQSRPGRTFKIAVPRLGRIANFDDLDPLAAEPEVSLHFIAPGQPLPGDADLILLPGSKSTRADLAAFRENGWDIDLAAHIRRKGRVIGLCGGYQMLGQKISDPEGIEGQAGSSVGLGYLEIETILTPHKALRKVTADANGIPVNGYEIHIGNSDGPGRERHWFTVDGQPEGAISPDGLIRGSYLHGMFDNDAFRASFLNELGTKSTLAHDAEIEECLDDLATHLETHLDLDALEALAEPIQPKV